jgi:hypothetical protein
MNATEYHDAGNSLWHEINALAQLMILSEASKKTTIQENNSTPGAGSLAPWWT